MYQYAILFVIFVELPLFLYQHGGEGRLSDQFAKSVQHILSDDMR